MNLSKSTLPIQHTRQSIHRCHALFTEFSRLYGQPQCSKLYQRKRRFTRTIASYTRFLCFHILCKKKIYPKTFKYPLFSYSCIYVAKGFRVSVEPQHVGPYTRSYYMTVNKLIKLSAIFSMLIWFQLCVL